MGSRRFKKRGPVRSKAERGRITLARYARQFEYVPGTVVDEMHPEDVRSFMGDLVADLMHYATAIGVDHGFLAMAESHYAEEILEETS